MVTTSQVCDLGEFRADDDAEVEVFFATLRKEQARFLGAMRHASSRLRRESGHLAHVAATQSRLTQQFFDAQRAIMLRRAEVDAEVLLIARLAEANAIEILAQTCVGEECSTSADVDLAPFAQEVVPSIPSGSSRSARQEIAALGVTVVRTMADVDSLERVIDEAFEPDEPDGAAAQRQLESLLNEWWTTGNQDGLAVIDDAHARAQMRVHVAKIEAGETGAARRPGGDSVVIAGREAVVSADAPASVAEFVMVPASVTPAVALPLLPPPMLIALRSADSSNLGSLLLSLSDLLDPSPEERAMAGAAELSSAITPIDASAGPGRLGDVESDDSFKRFWAKGAYVAAPQHLGAIRAEVLVPTVAALSLLASLAAWIG